ncbi:MAG: deoxynucleoside kinase [Prevotella sp.]|jgi:deoxyadenosine/deoxycytidine kinase|nr:deoxynucleoside kinase [Prevotella sp.]MDY6241879.1 deoxynucleoside kinase [Prevotella sp.]
MHIVIAGNIGSGKTTLTKMLARHYGWEARLESVVNNPYLTDYYQDMKRWALNLEVYFLKERFRDILKIAQSDKTIIQDRSIFEGVYIFTANNHDMGNMSDRDFDTYMGLFQSMMMVIKQPDLLVYLRASVDHLVDNVHKRGRDFEQNMRLDYLRNLNERYETFVDKYDGPKLIVDVNNVDFLHSRQDFADIVSQINQKLGLKSATLF